MKSFLFLLFVFFVNSAFPAFSKEHIGLIKYAIQEKYVLEVDYKDGTRLVEPHALAYTRRTDQLMLNGYWVGGDSSRSNTPHWVNYPLEDIDEIRLTDRIFISPRQGYKRAPNQIFREAVFQL